MAEFRKILDLWWSIGKSAFRVSELARTVGNYGYARVLLQRLKKKGDVALVRGGHLGVF